MQLLNTFDRRPLPSVAENDSGCHVLVFDSGVGGLSICGAIISRLPATKLTYLSDNAAFPYGDKSKDLLCDRVCEVILQALQSISVDMIVIACNTASTVALPSLRQRLSIPVVGVVPAIKTAASLSQSKIIGLLATPGTVARPYTQELIDSFAADCEVLKLGSSQLVSLIENHVMGAELSIEQLQPFVEKLREQPGGEDIDTVVLGCTHFPLILPAFEQLAPNWCWIDSGDAIARRVESLQSPPQKIPNTAVGGTTKHDAGIAHSPGGTFYLTGPLDCDERLRNYIAGLGFNRMSSLPTPASR